MACTDVGGMARGRARAATRTCLLSLLALCLPLLPAAPAAAISSPEITFPGEGETVDVGRLTVRGTLGGADERKVWVMYAVDVSGSTGSRGFDCDRSGSLDAGDDLNNDGQLGEILDCEIAGTIALNTSLAAVPGSEDRIRVGIVPFGSSAALADVGGQAGDQTFTSPAADEDGNDRDRTADIVQAASSMDQGRIGLFAPRFVGTGTNFNPALNTAFNALESKEGRKIVFLLTDGFGSLSQSTLDRMQSLGIEVRPFAISSGSDRCRSGGALDRIGQASGFPCQYAPDPTQLSAALTGGPSDVDRIEVQLDGGSPVVADIDPLGNFSAEVVVTSGPHTARATVYGKDGTTASDSVSFRAAAGTSFVALGDSYSAGEGLAPYADLPGPGQGCHQSEEGYATYVGDEEYELPASQQVNLDYVACSGAVLKNLLSVRQDARGERHIVQLDRVDAGADLVALTIGGNDVAFSEVVKHCATQLQCYEDGFATLNSGRSLSLDEFLRLRLALFRPEVESLFGTLRQRTDDRASVVAMNYPELFDDGIATRFGCIEEEFFSRDEREYLNEKAYDLQGALSTAADSAGVWFADVIDEFKGHRVCDGGINTQSEWLVGIDFVASKKVVGDGSFHPDPDGARAYARVLTTFLRDRADEGAPLTGAGLPRNPGAGTSSAQASSSGGDGATMRMASASSPQPAAATAGATPDLTQAEMDELARMEFGSAELQGLAAQRGAESCHDRAALGEQLILSGWGYQPGSSVEVSVKAASEPDARTYPQKLTADGGGAVSGSLIVPHDLQPSQGTSGEDPWTVMRVDLQGTSPDAGQRRLTTIIQIDPPEGECTAQIAAAGDIGAADGGAAPSASQTPGVPDTLLTLGPAGPTIDIIPGVSPNEIEPDSNQIFWVALRSSPGFDATTARHAKMRFGHSGSEQVPMGFRDEDVDGDGDVDRLLRFMARQTGIRCGDTIATLTYDDHPPFEGKFSVADRVAPTGCEDG